MNQQIDIFGAGEAHSIAPHFDPALVGSVEVVPVTDRDHVGENDVGKFGNNRQVFSVRILSQAGEVMHAETRDTSGQARALCGTWLQRINENRQSFLL